MNPQQDDDMVVYYSLDFTSRAVAVLALYYAGYLPGLVMNIVFLYQANHVRKETGREPFGYGCLMALLVMAITLPIVVACSIGLVVLVTGLLAATGNL
jgi:hypothetical protein